MNERQTHIPFIPWEERGERGFSNLTEFPLFPVCEPDLGKKEERESIHSLSLSLSPPLTLKENRNCRCQRKMPHKELGKREWMLGNGWLRSRVEKKNIAKFDILSFANLCKLAN